MWIDWGRKWLDSIRICLKRCFRADSGVAIRGDSNARAALLSMPQFLSWTAGSSCVKCSQKFVLQPGRQLGVGTSKCRTDFMNFAFSSRVRVHRSSYATTSPMTPGHGQSGVNGSPASKPAKAPMLDPSEFPNGLATVLAYCSPHCGRALWPIVWPIIG